MRTKIHEIPGKLLVEWDPEAKAMIDTWSTYEVSLAEFNEALCVEGVNYAKANGVKAWIADSSKANGVFSAEIQDFIKTVIFPVYAHIGVQHFIVIDSESVPTNMSVSQYIAQADFTGLHVLKASSAQGALDWLKNNG